MYAWILLRWALCMVAAAFQRLEALLFLREGVDPNDLVVVIQGFIRDQWEPTWIPALGAIGLPVNQDRRSRVEGFQLRPQVWDEPAAGGHDADAWLRVSDLLGYMLSLFGVVWHRDSMDTVARRVDENATQTRRGVREVAPDAFLAWCADPDNRGDGRGAGAFTSNSLANRNWNSPHETGTREDVERGVCVHLASHLAMDCHDPGDEDDTDNDDSAAAMGWPETPNSRIRRELLALPLTL